jgi:hypothetical protein
MKKNLLDFSAMFIGLALLYWLVSKGYIKLMVISL